MKLGEKGELMAKYYLEKNGYTILEKNFRTRYGEIDLIGKFKDEIVFVEVKTRSSLNYGLPCEAINLKKQRKIIGTANYYLLVSGNRDSKCRIDVIEILIFNKKPFLRHSTNVF